MAERESKSESLPRGGADAWDDGPAGALLTAEFFGASAPAVGLLKFWNGTSWIAKPLKWWNGTSWIAS